MKKRITKLNCGSHPDVWKQNGDAVLFASPSFREIDQCITSSLPSCMREFGSSFPRLTHTRMDCVQIQGR
ncbi:hypothetical protein OUZ56_030742 [Daphnia magna]|uniref:Uncharacterized protein n=1 Tax=Daphnia magna TaxID=35525 RepID=A0ABQ9ZS66_9CRUS|nr:hypothetical protein OUZ56_030742 [Daphnia magna]